MACLSREAAKGHDAFMPAKHLLLVVHHNSLAKINARIAEGSKLAGLFVFTVERMRNQLTARPAEPPRCWGCNKHQHGGLSHISSVIPPTENLVSLMSEMREWLDARRIEPDIFRHTVKEASVTIHLQFKVESEAIAFAQAFSGQLMS